MTEKIPVKNSVAPGTVELVKPLDAPPRLSAKKKPGKYTFYPGYVLHFHHFPSKGCKGDFVVTRTMLDSEGFFVPKSRCVMDSNGSARYDPFDVGV